MRLVIGSANMLLDDWTINGNVFFCEDFKMETKSSIKSDNSL